MQCRGNQWTADAKKKSSKGNLASAVPWFSRHCIPLTLQSNLSAGIGISDVEIEAGGA
jgi:hypothetical protein